MWVSPKLRTMSVRVILIDFELLVAAAMTELPPPMLCHCRQTERACESDGTWEVQVCENSFDYIARGRYHFYRFLYPCTLPHGARDPTLALNLTLSTLIANAASARGKIYSSTLCFFFFFFVCLISTSSSSSSLC